MIENPRDINKLLSLNVDLGYLLKNPDSNTPDRIFEAIANKLNQMQYCLVHKDDMQQVREPSEDKATPSEPNPLASQLIPMENDK